MGGGRFAQGLAGLCVLGVPIYLGMDSILCVGAFEPLFWMGCVAVLIDIVRTGNSRLWLWFGVVAGLGLENKYAMLVFGLAALIAILLTPLRRELRKPWLWGAAVLGSADLPSDAVMADPQRLPVVGGHGQHPAHGQERGARALAHGGEPPH